MQMELQVLYPVKKPYLKFLPGFFQKAAFPFYKQFS